LLTKRFGKAFIIGIPTEFEGKGTSRYNDKVAVMSD
jgi:hypothetical protein